jgi:hypothetical protein
VNANEAVPSISRNVSSASAGQLADSYGHLPIKQWFEIGQDEPRISRELEKESGIREGMFIAACMRGLARDPVTTLFKYQSG